MASVFVHTDFVPGDQEGFGLWRTEHYYDHAQLNLLCRNLSTPRVLPEYDILNWQDGEEEKRLWLAGHMDMHQALRDVTGVTGVDLNEVDWENPISLFNWLENHAAEHDLFDQLLGV